MRAKKKYFVDLGKKRFAILANSIIQAAVFAIKQEYEKIKHLEFEDEENPLKTIIDTEYPIVEVREITDNGWDDSEVVEIHLADVLILLERLRDQP